MWRLYADDTRGVCLEFNTKTMDEKEGFFLRKVCYEDDQPYNIFVRFVRLLKEFQEESGGFIFVFNNWDLWRAFIKSKEYKVEQEIRLAYIPSKDGIVKPEIKWLMTKSNQILSEYIDIKGLKAHSGLLKRPKCISGKRALFRPSAICSIPASAPCPVCEPG